MTFDREKWRSECYSFYEGESACFEFVPKDLLAILERVHDEARAEAFEEVAAFSDKLRWHWVDGKLLERAEGANIIGQHYRAIAAAKKEKTYHQFLAEDVGDGSGNR